MAIPAKFLNDIQTKDTQIFSKVVIHTEDDLNFNLYYSTNKLTFQGVGMDSNKTVYWKPLLLKLPSAKEKYDIDTKKFVVSKLNLSLSNALYGGERISSILANIGLVGKKVTVFFQTQSAETNDDCLLVFYGEVKRVKHDSKKIDLEVHDLGTGLHKELPQTYLDDLVGEASAGRPVPILYGRQEYAPAVVQNGGTHYKVWFDTVPGLGGMNNPWETSGKLTGTTNYMGFSKRKGFQNPNIQAGYGPLQIFINGKYGEIYRKTWAFEHPLPDLFPGWEIGGLENTSREDWFDGEGLTFLQWTAFQSGQTQHNYPIAGYEQTEEFDYLTDSHLKIYKTSQLGTDNSLTARFLYKPSSVSISVIKEGQSGYPELMEEIASDDEDNFAQSAVNGIYWGATGFGGFSQHENIIPAFHTSNAEGDDIPDEMYMRSDHDDYAFRIRLVEFNFSTDPEVDEKRIQHTEVYINGLRQWTTADPYYPIEWNDTVSGDWTAPGTYFANDTGNTVMGTAGAITNAADKGHLGFTAEGNLDNQASSYYPRETYGMDGAWSFSNTNPNPSYELSESTIIHDGVEVPFAPAFDFGCYSPGNHYTVGVVRQWSGCASTKEFKAEFYQEFRNNWETDSQIGINVTDTTFVPRLRQVDVMSIVHIGTPFQHPICVNMRGRVYKGYPEHQGLWDEGKFFIRPADIIRSIIEVELGFYDFDETDYNLAIIEHENWNFCCSVKDPIGSKELIEDIAQYTKMFPKFGIDGKFRFNTIKKAYKEADWDEATPIEYSDLIDYKFELTKIEDVVSSVDLYYRWDHYNESCSKRWSDVMDYGHASSGNWTEQPPPVGMTTTGYTYSNTVGGKDYQGVAGDDSCFLPQHDESELAFYGIEDIKDNIKKIECKYFADWTQDNNEGNVIMSGPSGGDDYYNKFGYYTAYKVHDYIYNQFRNQHLVFKLKLPIKYVWIDVGKILKFEKLFNGIDSYGINYTKLQNINNQYRYPLFFVTAVSKSVSHIDVTCIQLHWLGENSGVMGIDQDDLAFWESIDGDEGEEVEIYPPFIPDSTDIPVWGCTDPTANNYNPDATSNDDSCQYDIIGCGDPNATNYNPDATIIDNTICNYYHGCTDPTAMNYAPDATIDDGSCYFGWGDINTVQFGGEYFNGEIPSGERFFYKNTQKFQYIDFTLGGTFGYDDLAQIEEAYTDFQGLAFFVGRNTSNYEIPNDTFQWIFGFDMTTAQRWTVNGVPKDSLESFLFDNPDTVSEGQYPDGTELITVRFGPRDFSGWQYPNTVLFDLTDAEINETTQGLMDIGTYTTNFLNWYGDYKWTLSILWSDDSYTLVWNLQFGDSMSFASNIWTFYLGPNAQGNATPIIKNAIYPSISGEYSGADELGIPPDAILNDQFEDADDVLNAFPVIVDKNQNLPDIAGFGSEFGGAEGLTSLDFMATEITITFHPDLIQKTPNETPRYFQFNTQWNIDFTDETTSLYIEPESSVLGDLSGDLVVNVLDIVILVNAIMGSEELTPQQFLNADINQDGELDVLDIVSMVNIILDEGGT